MAGVLTFSCTHKTELPNEKPVDIQFEKEIGSVQEDKDIQSLIYEYSLKRTNPVITVKSKVEGEIINSELNQYNSQLVDSSTLLLSIDNKTAFIAIREGKLRLIEELKNEQNKVEAKLYADYQDFSGLIQTDNLLPRLSAERFSIDFINWFQQSKIYKNTYLHVQEMEAKMADYFYVNEEPIYLLDINVRKGTYVKKGQQLYRYMLPTKDIKYEISVPFNKEDVSEIQLLDDLKEKKFIYHIENRKLTIVLPFTKAVSLDEIKAKVVLKHLES